MQKTMLLVLFVFAAGLLRAQQNFKIVNQKPVAGSLITIEYKPDNTVLKDLDDFDVTAYLLEGSMPLAKEVPMKKEGEVFHGMVQTNDSTKALFFSFSKGDLRDNNKDEGYYTALYDKTGKVKAGAYLSLGQAFSRFGQLWGLKPNPEKGTTFLKKEFVSPTAKAKFSNEYLEYLSGSADKKDQDLLKTLLAQKLQKKNLLEEDLLGIKYFYERVLKDRQKAAAVMAEVKKRFPQGAWKKEEAIGRFFGAKSLAEKEKVYNELSAAAGSRKGNDEQLLGFMGSQIIGMYAESGDFDKVKKFLDQQPASVSKANSLNEIAWKMAGEGINGKPLNVDLGLELSEQSLAVVNEEMRVMKNRPSFQTQKQYVESLGSSYHTFADTYAVLLYHKGNYEKAYAISKAAVEHFKRNDASLNETFARIAEKARSKAEAQAELAKFIEEGKYTPSMKEQLKAIYMGANNSEAQWTAYVNSLDEKAYNAIKAGVMKKIINMPAPQFALKDMAGNEVSLASLKGKVVVLDFWATWCGPCIASFPAMQKAVDQFKDNSDVVFLFIDTWEEGDDRKKKVTDFIAKNKYTFTVLYDEVKTKGSNDFVVIGSYKVDGIPAKFVIDRNGQIRFKSTGFGGGLDGAVKEMTAMIDIAAAESGAPIKKAF